MKKGILITSIIFSLLFIAIVVVLATVDFNRLGKENVYVQIVDDGEAEETVTASGETFIRYYYERPAFTEEGEQMTVEFTSSTNLRKDAYLMLYMNDEVVTSYDEVTADQIPDVVLGEFD